MKTKFALYPIALFTAFSLTQAFAHHSFLAEFDPDSPIEIEGTVIKVEWTNPHTYFFIEVESEDGDFEEWALEWIDTQRLASRHLEGWRHRDSNRHGSQGW